MRTRSATSFKASFGKADILAALLSVSRGVGKVWAVRLWEMETVNALGWTEGQWVRLALAERSRKVCAHKLSDWLGALEAEREMAKMRARRG